MKKIKQTVASAEEHEDQTAASSAVTLEELLPGEDAVIFAVHGEGALYGRLLDMGFTPHTAVRVEKTAPFGDPIEVSLRGYLLTLRRADAHLIEVQRTHRRKAKR